MRLPDVVTLEEWQQARDALLVKEKKLTRALDALAAERRRLPMVHFENDYEFTGSDMPPEQLFGWRRQMGWTMPFYSSHGTTFVADCGLGDGFALSVFLRDGNQVYRTYVTQARGVDRLRPDLNLLDLTPYGRQEDREDSPPGWPQDPTMSRMRHHDEY